MSISRTWHAAAVALAVVGGGLAPAPARSQPAGAASTGADDPPEAIDAGDEATGSAAAPSGPAAPADPAQRQLWLEQELTRRVAARPRLAAARLGIEVVDLASGERLWARDPDSAYNLASTTKVITAAAALAQLGPSFRWRTSVLVRPGAFDRRTGVVDGDLHVRGHGDPTLTSADLRGLADELRVLGVRRVAGGLVLDRTYFDEVDEPPHYDEQPKERAGFRAPIGALSLERNATVIVVEPEPSGAGAARVRLDPNAPEAVRLVRAEVLTVTQGRSSVRVVVEPQRDHLAISVTGQVNVDDGVFYTRRRVDAPAVVALEVLRRALADEGIRLGRRDAAPAPAPVGARVLATHESADLAEVVRKMNKASDNFIAETVLKTLGAERRGAPGASWADGQAAVAAFLEGCGVAPGAARVGNGSGLFASTAVTPAQLVAVLRCGLADARVGPELLTSLPIGGVDGTLRRRLQGPEVSGRVRAKTGTLATVTTLAGIAGVATTRQAAFAVLVNDATGGQRADARALQDEIASALVAWSAP